MLSIVLQAWRSWRNAKAVALLAAIALAAGIGSTTAIYTVVHAVLLKPLPYEHGERFVALYGARLSEPGLRSSSTYPDMLIYQQWTRSFDVFGWFKLSDFNLTSPGQPQHINGVEITPTLADHLGVNPIMGRWFHDPASESGGASLAVISTGLWKRLGADPNILGKSLTLNSHTYTVTGVMPPWFRLPVGGPGAPMDYTRSDVWIPLDPHIEEQDRTSGMYFCYARLKPGIRFAEAEADVARAAAEIARDHPSYRAQLDDLRSVVVSEIRPTLLLLFAAAGLLLLITCANVSGLLVARSVARARETAIRVALGAAQRQLALQYFLEGLLVSLAGAVAGIFISFALVRVVISIAEGYIPRADEITVDWTVLLFALGTACLASMISSFAPLWQAVNTSPNAVLSDGARASEPGQSRRLSQYLVIAEIAVGFTLLTGSAILIAQLEKLTRVWPGFDPNQVLTFELTANEKEYPSFKEKLVPYQERLIQALEAIPGVRSAAFINQLPLEGCCYSTSIFPEGRTMDPKTVQRISYLNISEGYLRTMRIPLVRGRFFQEHDTGEDPILAVINQAAARYYWPDRDPVGSYGHLAGASGPRFQVIGVVGDVRNDGLGSPTVPEIYLSSAVFAAWRMHFIVRSPLPQKTLAPEIRRAVQGVNATQPIYHFEMMSDVAQGSLALQRVSSLVTGFFAVAALLMATLGVYGVVAYSVRQRTVEIGTRMALGAMRRDLLRMVIGGGMKMAVYGIVIGGVAIVPTTWLLVNTFGIHDIDPRSFLYSTAVVIGVAGLASSFPGWRATLLSPMVAIRNQPESMWQSTQRGIRHVVEGISSLIPLRDEAQMLSEGTLLPNFIDAVRRAESPSQALYVALTMLCEKIGCVSATLLETSGAGEYRCSATTPLAVPSSCSLPPDGFLLTRLSFYTSPLPLTEHDFDALLRWGTQNNKPKYVAELDALMKSGARLVVALRAKNEILAVLLLGAPLGREEYSPVQKQVLHTCAEQFALILENVRLTNRLIEQEILRRDVALAVEVQKRLLPEQPPEAAIAALAAVSFPARSVGGDYYDFLDVGDHRIGIALADIAGKGIAAALIMSVVQASLRIIAAEENISLPQLAAKLNHFLYRSTKSNSYATFFYAQIDETNRLRYVNAGHNPPYLLRSINVNGTGPPDDSKLKIQELSTGGTVLGLFPQMSYEEGAIDLRPGDVLMAFTDGVTEALNPHDEEFGEERLKNLLRQVVDLPVQEMCTRISSELRSWIKDAAQYDDLTFILMKVK